MSTVVAFVGYPASGKSEAARMAADMGIPVVCMGDVVREEAARMGLSPTDEALGAVACMLREREGMDSIARRTLPTLRRLLTEHDVVVLDGIRGIAEVHFFRQHLGAAFRLVHILSPFSLRLERIRSRQRSDAILTPEELRRRDEREEGWGLREAMAMADVVIANEGTLEELRERIEKVLRS
ncbi:AAA family ATPase [Methermicoccus shengliensis]|uniref:Flagellar hook-basal body complex protein FliE n=1 Tax=Methermicoccus shengliensis TaxID=660064 RepID=A0A832VWM9_9EURY|nr:AAA family ATPase [Methermicoccus shengliensis]KUK04467.1 MAG: hypothetical protein XD46_0785 [Euryarchaeota archaeon 55_53]KUK30094.1 MAG: hypothetical protein XD62_0816 [Methanosarcinales archeaon 56_1174]MDI3487490.1 hypothetical protein [Methanosarcinales archaeon]MDN5295182.1 hypothetical protein [Methanosarcinales archaeon]HIH69167.1 flagellar hook-basal body complex protein FliE [Methermicoccus shengliensis]